MMNDFEHQTMSRRFKLKKTALAVSSALATAAAPMGAQAQDPGETEILEEVVVTGTLIRGTEVTGSLAIDVTAENIVELGATSTNEILASVPQVSNLFNSRPEEDPRAASSITVNRPNLRNMPGFNSASGSVTLLLMDGHRVAPVGVLEATVDPDIFFGSTLSNIGIVTDGGSSLYGADAVAGVINFVTKDSFDGVQIDLNGNFGDDYDASDISLMAGTSWDTGSIMVALNHTERDGFLNGDRDWLQNGFYDDTSGEFTPVEGTECLEPVGTNYGWFWYGAYGIWTDNPGAPGTGFQSAGDPGCDEFSASSAIQDQERDGLFLSYQQDLNSNVSFGLKSYFSERESRRKGYPLGATSEAAVDVTVNPAALDQATIDQFGLPQPTPGENYLYPAGAGFSFGAHPAYEDRDIETRILTYGLAPELTIDMDNGWQLRNSLYYGRSLNSNTVPSVNNTLVNAAVAAATLDALDVASASNDLVTNILNWENETQTVHELFSARVVADGKVMDLPAGELRMAAGFEVASERAKSRSGTGRRGFIAGRDFQETTRDNVSAFVEFAIPVSETLELTVSARHDDYSDFGNTTNANIGFDFSPTDRFSVFGHWGESFNAPTALDGLAIATGRFATQTVNQTEEADVFNEWDGMGGGTVILDGVFPNLGPQTAETWALGFDLEPLDGLTFGVNYYSIEFVDILGQIGNPTIDDRMNFPDKFIWNPTPALYQEILDSLANPDFANGIIDPANPTADMTYFFDRRTNNFSEAELEGIDFSVSYGHDTGIGSFIYGLSGNHQLKFDLVEGSVPNDMLAFASDLSVQGILGWERNSWRTKLTLRYTDGFTATETANNQDSVDSFLTTNLFVGYDFQGQGFTDGLSLRFIVDNIFDEDPPEYRRDSTDLNFSGFTYGQVVKVGLTKTFQ